MADEAATVEFSETTKELGDKIVALTLKEAKELSDYLKEVHGIEPAAGGGAVVMAAPGQAAEAEAEEKTEFDVVLTGFGDKKLDVVRAVKKVAGIEKLMEAKKLVESCPAPIKEGVSKEEAEQIKAEIEKAGGSVEIK